MKWNLRKTQELFWQLTQAPKGVAYKLRDLQQDPAFPLKEIKEVFKEREAGEAKNRLEIYAQMYFWRLFDCLEEDFSVTSSILGEINYHRLIVDYIQRYPSTFQDIAEVGLHLPEFVKSHPLGPEGGRPWLPDLVRLEWLRVEVGREADDSPITFLDLNKIDPKDWPKLRFRPISALRILTSEWDVLSPWRQYVIEKKKLIDYQVVPQKYHLLLWRKDYRFFIASLEPDQVEVLKSFTQGIEFQEVCEKLADDSPEPALSRVTQYLSQWVQEQVLTLSSSPT